MVGRLLQNSRTGHSCVQQKYLYLTTAFFVQLQGITFIELQRTNNEADYNLSIQLQERFIHSRILY